MARKFIRRATPPKEVPTKKKPKLSKMDEFRDSFSFLKKPETESPTMPKKISTFTSDEISNLMFRISAWRDYTDDLIYEALRDFLQAKEKYQYAWDIAMITVRGTSVKEKEAKIRTQDKIKVLREDLTEKEMFYDLLERKHENYTNNIAIISREITRRGNM